MSRSRRLTLQARWPVRNSKPISIDRGSNLCFWAQQGMQSGSRRIEFAQQYVAVPLVVAFDEYNGMESKTRVLTLKAAMTLQETKQHVKDASGIEIVEPRTTFRQDKRTLIPDLAGVAPHPRPHLQ